MYGPNHLLFQLFGRVGTSLCMDPTIYFFKCLVELELCYVWTQPFSFSIAWGSGNLDMYGPTHLVYQLCGRGRGKFDIRGYIQIFSFSIISGSGNWDMHGPKHSVCIVGMLK
jgi:hypothetical protein